MKNNGVFEALKTNGYSFLALPVDDLIDRVMQGYEAFLQESPELRTAWNFISKKDSSWQLGFLPREEPINTMTGHPYDFKDVFHYQPGLITLLRDRKVNTEGFDSWLQDLQELFSEVSNVANPIVSEIQRKYPIGSKDLSNYEGFHGGNTLRLLKYHMKNRKEGVIGLGHYDESLVTIKVFQNIAGIRIGSPTETQLVSIPQGRNIVYAGKKAAVVTKGAIQPLWHDIIDARKDGEESVKRSSIIFFADTE